MARCLGLSEPGVEVWIAPCWFCMLHQLLGIVVDFLGVFWVAGGASGLGGAACMSLWWCGPFRAMEL